MNNQVSKCTKLKRIGDGAFYGSFLNTIILPDSIEELHQYTFNGNCSKFYIPKNINSKSFENIVKTFRMKENPDTIFYIHPDMLYADRYGIKEIIKKFPNKFGVREV